MKSIWNTFFLRVKISHRFVPLSVFVIMLIVFAYFSTMFALKTQKFMVPDEYTHFPFSKFYAATWGIPQDNQESYQYGYLGHRPFLYYWINGRAINAIRIFFPGAGDWKLMVALRLVNVFYSILSVIFCYLLSREIIKNPWWQLLVVFLLVNTLMFIFLSGGINYDNLTNLCSFASIYFFARIFNGKDFIKNSLLGISSIFIGILVKITVLPLAISLFFLWAVYVIRNRAIINFNFKHLRHWKNFGLLAIVIVFMLLDFSVYGVNLIKYKTISPPCKLVLTEEQCSVNYVSQRDKRLFPAEKITLQDILKGGSPDPAEWFFEYWIDRNLEMVYGIAAGVTYYPDFIITVYRVFLLSVLLIAIRFWKNVPFTLVGLTITFIIYILILLQTNYNGELISGFKHLGIQGRYTFPVIGILYTLIVYSLSVISNKYLSAAMLVFALLLFLIGGPLVALQNKAAINFPRQAIPSEANSGEITGITEISQDFVSECNGTIDQVELQFVTFKRHNSHNVNIRLVRQDINQVIVNQTVAADSFSNEIWRKMLNPPLSNSAGASYRIIVTSPESVSGDAIAVGSSLGDVFPSGQAYKNGNPTGTDLNFRYRCLRPVLQDILIR